MRLSDTRYSAKGTEGKWRYYQIPVTQLKGPTSDTRYSAKGTKGEQQSKIEMRTYAISIYGYVRGRQI